MIRKDYDSPLDADRAQGTLPAFVASLLLWTLCLVVVTML